MQSQATPEITAEMLQQNPVLFSYLIFIGLVMLIIGAGSLASWSWILYRRASGLSLMPMKLPWQPSCWSLLDIALIAACVVVLQVVIGRLVLQALRNEGSEEVSLEAIAAGGLATLASVVAGVIWIGLRYRQWPSHLGFSRIELPVAMVGLVTGLAALPLVYLMMIAVSVLSNSQYEHPLISSTAQSGTLLSFLLAFFAAAIAAPVAEEFLFRVILQGWLQSLWFKSVGANLIGLASQPSPSDGLELPTPIPVATATDLQPLVESSQIGQPFRQPNDLEPIILAELIAAPSESVVGQAIDEQSRPILVPTDISLPAQVTNNPYAPSTRCVTPSNTQTVPQAVIPPLWPAIFTGILFGLAHISYGMSFVPLSVLGILLGIVYRQTHSIWPCIMIHAMLNSLSMLMLGLLILIQQATT